MDRWFDESGVIVRNPAGGVCTERTTGEQRDLESHSSGSLFGTFRGRPGRIPRPANSPVKRESGGRL